MSEKLPESTSTDKNTEKKDVNKKRPEDLRRSFREAFGSLIDKVNIPKDSENNSLSEEE